MALSVKRVRRKRNKLSPAPVSNGGWVSVPDVSARRGRRTKKRSARKEKIVNFRTKLRPTERDFSEYNFEVHLKKEMLPRTGHGPSQWIWKNHSRKPQTRRQNYSYLRISSEIKGDHEPIIEHMKTMVPVRVRRTRTDRVQRTRMFFKDENDLVLLKTLYADFVSKIYRLVDEK